MKKDQFKRIFLEYKKYYKFGINDQNTSSWRRNSEMNGLVRASEILSDKNKNNFK